MRYKIAVTKNANNNHSFFFFFLSIFFFFIAVHITADRWLPKTSPSFSILSCPLPNLLQPVLRSRPSNSFWPFFCPASLSRVRLGYFLGPFVIFHSCYMSSRTFHFMDYACHFCFRSYHFIPNLAILGDVK